MDVSFVCETCDTSFQRREHYQRHLRTHTKETPFTCSQCKQAFGRVDSLSRHHTTVHMGNAGQDSAAQQGGRRRVSQACKPCSITKVRCDGQRPCQRCDRQGHECRYETPAKRKQSNVTNVQDDVTDDSNKPTSPKRGRTLDMVVERPLHFDLAPTLPGVGEQSTDAITIPHGIERTTAESQSLRNQSAHLETIPSLPADRPPAEVIVNPEAASLNKASAVTDYNGWTMTIPTSSFSFGDTLDTDSWLSFDTDPTFLSPLMCSDAAFEAYSSMWFASAEPKSLVSIFAAPMQQSPIAQLYSRAHSPELDKDSVGPRNFRPTSIELDAQLAFPDMEELAKNDIDQENLAHVDDFGPDVVGKITEYASKVEQNGSFPRFTELRIPPAPVLNAWIQLYFEHLHPVFPILHKQTFDSSNRHWLLVFVVATLGAHFSDLKNSSTCARAMHELVRRQSASMYEQRNQYGRELFIIQVVLLNNIGLLFSGERRALEVAEILQALPPTLARRKGLFINQLPYEKVAQMQISFSQKWQVWALDEERRRTGFAVWLLDSQYNDNFDLSGLVRSEELQMSLPQSEAHWNSTSAQSWASQSPGIAALNKDSSLEHVIRQDSWKATWSKTGTIGKQVLLQQLFDVMNCPSVHLSAPSFTEHEKLKAEEILCELLSMADDEDLEQPISEIKASIAHQIFISAAFVARKAPTRNVTAIALKTIYSRMSDSTWAELGEQWQKAGGQARLAAFWAARVLHIVRSHRCAHFATPVSLLRAVLVLWLYSVLSERQEHNFRYPPPAPSVVLGPKNLQNMGSLDLFQNGWSDLKLPGIGSLFCAQGRCRLLDESITLMRSLRCWAISTSYTELLVRLRATEKSRNRDGNVGHTTGQ